MNEIEQQYKTIKQKVKSASCKLNLTNNETTRKAYDDAISEQMEFERVHNIKRKYITT